MENHLKIAGFLANLSDQQFKIGKFSFGIEPIIGMIPIFGDAFGLLLSLYIYGIAHKMKVSKWDRLLMILNILVDFLIGLVPVIGDIFDFAFKANYRNYLILRKYKKDKFIEGELI